MADHTFKLVGPDDGAVSEEAGTTTSTAPNVLAHKLVTYTGSLTDVTNAYKARGWVAVGAGDVRPARVTFTQTYSTTGTTVAALPSFSAPGITASYSGGLLLLTDAARNTGLNDLATKCAALEAEVIALRAGETETRQLVNSLIDTLQAFGLAL